MSASVTVGSLLPYPWTWGDVLRRAYGPERGIAKRAARDLGISVETVKAWMRDRFSPSFDTCVVLVRRSSRLRMAVLSMILEGTEDELLAALDREASRRARELCRQERAAARCASAEEG